MSFVNKTSVGTAVEVRVREGAGPKDKVANDLIIPLTTLQLGILSVH